MRNFRGILQLSFLSLSVTVAAQKAPPPIPGPQTKPVVALSEISRIKVPMHGPNGVGVGLPMFCNSEGTLFLRIITQTDFVDLVSISGDGRTVRHFEKSKISDLPNPRIGTFFATGSDVYVSAIGGKEESATLAVPHKDGTTTREKAVIRKDVKTYLAHYKSDGSYVGAVPLDIDFRLLRFGVFPTGEILVTGMKDGTGEPRIGLLQANGQILRYLAPEADVDRDAPQFKQGNETRSLLMSPETFLRVIMSSTIMPSGNELILIRPGSDPRIFAVTAGGEVIRQKLEMPGRYSLLGLIPTPTGWIGQFSQPAGANGMKLMLFSFERQSGTATHEYQYPGPFGLGLACSEGNDFLFLQEETEDSFTLVRAEPSGNPK